MVLFFLSPCHIFKSENEGSITDTKTPSFIAPGCVGWDRAAHVPFLVLPCYSAVRPKFASATAWGSVLFLPRTEAPLQLNEGRVRFK